MKTRELLTCDIKSFGAKMEKIKLKEVHQHIERIAKSLGEQDPNALMEAVISNIFREDLPDSAGAEMDRVFEAIAGRIDPTADNMDTFLRLAALCVAWLRKVVNHEARREVQNRWHESRGHHHCDDPECDHHHEDEEYPETDPSALASGVRSALG